MFKQLWGTSRSHQCVSQAETGYCRWAEWHHSCRERKSVSLARPQTSLQALPNLSSPYSLRRSTVCTAVCICSQTPANVQTPTLTKPRKLKKAGFTNRNERFLMSFLPCEKQSHHHWCQWPLRRLSWIFHKSLWMHKPVWCSQEFHLQGRSRQQQAFLCTSWDSLAFRSDPLTWSLVQPDPCSPVHKTLHTRREPNVRSIFSILLIWGLSKFQGIFYISCSWMKLLSYLSRKLCIYKVLKLPC